MVVSLSFFTHAFDAVTVVKLKKYTFFGILGKDFLYFIYYKQPNMIIFLWGIDVLICKRHLHCEKGLVTLITVSKLVIWNYWLDNFIIRHTANLCNFKRMGLLTFSKVKLIPFTV